MALVILKRELDEAVIRKARKEKTLLPKGGRDWMGYTSEEAVQ